MTRTRTFLLAFAFALALPVVAQAQAQTKPAPTKSTAKPKAKKETEAEMQKEAKVSLDAATAIALKEVPGSTVKSHELEREKGKLVYTFDMKIAGKSGIEEVNVDAATGEKVGKVEHESGSAAKKAAVKKP